MYKTNKSWLRNLTNMSLIEFRVQVKLDLFIHSNSRINPLLNFNVIGTRLILLVDLNESNNEMEINEGNHICGHVTIPSFYWSRDFVTMFGLVISFSNLNFKM